VDIETEKRVEEDDSPWIRYVDDGLTGIEGKAVDYRAGTWEKPRRVRSFIKRTKMSICLVWIMEILQQRDILFRKTMKNLI